MVSRGDLPMWAILLRIDGRHTRARKKTKRYLSKTFDRVTSKTPVPTLHMTFAAVVRDVPFAFASPFELC